MPNIDSNIQIIREGVYGRDVREAIADGMEQINDVADSYAGAAAISAAQAQVAAETAQQYADSNILSQSWAVGGTGTRPGEDTNNAKYWATTAGGVSRVDAIVGYASNNKRTLQFARSGKIVVVESDGWTNMGEMGVADRVIGTIPAGYLPSKSALTPYGTGKFLFTTGGQIIARYNGVGNFEDWFVSCTYTIP